jgi:2-polyprenyl-3-methyl-5-hydroxy-6-metoxy-1,4-benzoquinol methylase
MRLDSAMPTRRSEAAQTKREWEDLAQLDPLWAILTDRKHQFGGWDAKEFFASGEREIGQLMQSCGLGAGDNGRALDFGCGVGRLSRSLRSYFGEVHGVDISEQMIRLAREHAPSCHFQVNQTDNLSLFRDNFFDFVYSNIVLQHQRTKELAASYIREFVRITRPAGTIVFQIPYKLSARQRMQPRRRAYSLLRALGFSPDILYNRFHLNPMRTICLSPLEVEAAVSGAGGRLLRSSFDNFNIYSKTYTVTK